jgi:hypothetical protein
VTWNQKWTTQAWTADPVFYRRENTNDNKQVDPVMDKKELLSVDRIVRIGLTLQCAAERRMTEQPR